MGSTYVSFKSGLTRNNFHEERLLTHDHNSVSEYYALTSIELVV